MIARLAKGVLPANTQIQKDALLALHKSATVFVSYIAAKYAHACFPLISLRSSWFTTISVCALKLTFHSANESVQSSGKKTITPQDMMAALKDCEFAEFLPRVESELHSPSCPACI